jgi:hypothetical protein
MKIGLFIGNDKEVRGPYKVAANLLAGLSKINVEVTINEIQELTGCLRSGIPKYYDLPKSTVMGPNLVVLPTDDSVIWTLYKNFVVPSNWVKDLYKSCYLCEDSNITAWPVGIDTEKFNYLNRNKDIDCLVYLKGREIHEIGDLLDRNGLSKVTLTYGLYNEEQLIEYTKRCKFCILLTGTESQGIAYMEILSSGLPCFVLDTPTWRGAPATSVPYFSNSCGKICGRDPHRDFEEFLKNLDKYTPRQYIMDYHTLEKSASRYVEILLDGKNNV